MRGRHVGAAAALLALTVMAAAACSPRVDLANAAAWFDNLETIGPSGLVGGGPTVVAEKPPPGSDVGTHGADVL